MRVTFASGWTILISAAISIPTALKESGVEVVMGARVQDTVRGDESAPAKYTLKLSVAESE
jgi:hypothetical protein